MHSAVRVTYTDVHYDTSCTPYTCGAHVGDVPHTALLEYSSLIELRLAIVGSVKTNRASLACS